MTSRPNELALLLDSCATTDLATTLARLPAENRADLLRHAAARHPALVDWTFAQGTGDELRALAANPRLDGEQLDRLVTCAHQRAATDGKPVDGVLAATVYRHRNTTAALRRRLLEAPDPPDELRSCVMHMTARRLLGPALDCPHPDLAKRAAILARGPKGARPANTPAALYAWFKGTTYTSPKSHALLRGRLALFRTDTWKPADWAALAALHDADPLDPAPCTVLVELPECPRDIALALLHDDSGDDVRADTLTAGLRYGTFTAADVVRRAPHATHLLRTLECFDRDRDPLAHAAHIRALHRELTALVRESLGEDPAVWRTLLGHLSAGDFPGTLPDLAAAARSTPAPPHPRRAWPHTQQVSTSPFTHLLRFAEPAALSGILGALDPHDLGEIAHYDIQKPLPDALVDAFLDHAGPELLDVFMPHHAYHDRTRACLLRRDDPSVNAALLRGSDVPRRTWYEIASGTPHTPGSEARVPLHPEVLAHLRGEGGEGGRDERRPGSGSAARFAVHTRDADLVLGALHRPLTTAHQITACRFLAASGRITELAELAERHGPLDPLLGTAIRRTLAVRGPRALDRRLAALDRAQAVHDLQHGTAEAVHAQLERDEPPPWPEVQSLLATGRTPARSRELLAEHPDLPDEVAIALLRADDGTTAVPFLLAHRSRTWATAALGMLPVVPTWMEGHLHPDLLWSARCLESGALTAEDVFALGRPARSVLRLIGAYPYELGVLRERMAEETARLSADRSDAWAVAAALLDEFTGTLTELIATVAAATSPVD
ncbi:hypothetical protein [Yinghuangia sp. YIM S09857]|uniref:hypothetical protein n=1 Tax=Yinghuangia sp. YIM S09857 TaxID=3436929 RepID=UPI003F52E909